MTHHRLHRPDRIGNQAAVVIGFGCQDPLGHKTGNMRCIPCTIFIRRVPFGPGAPLPPGIHHKVCVTGTGPHQPVEGETAASAVTDIFDDAGQLDCSFGRQNQPTLNRLAFIAGKTHIEGLELLQMIIDRFENRIERIGTSFLQGALPERIPIGRFRNLRVIFFQLFERHIKKSHDALLCSSLFTGYRFTRKFITK
jgi:hypothetical protein